MRIYRVGHLYTAFHKAAADHVQLSTSDLRATALNTMPQSYCHITVLMQSQPTLSAIPILPYQRLRTDMR